MHILVFYYSKTGHTLKAAQAVAEGIRAAGSSADLVPVKDMATTALERYDAIILGSPCWKAAFSDAAYPMGVATPLSKALDQLAPAAFAGKKCGAFAVNAGKGGEITVRNLGAFAQGRGCASFREGPVGQAGSPLSLWKGPDLKPEDLARFRAYGAAFAQA